MTTSRARTDAADRLTRVTGALGLMWGVVLMARGRDVWVAVDGRVPARVDELALPVLGVRHFMQGGAQVMAPGRFQRLFVGVDVAHALSMVAVAAVDERRRRPALVSGVAAGAIAWLSATAYRW
ncbi:MAG: hypothetical protein ABJA89_07760 [Lapillicoccus sp.]